MKKEDKKLENKAWEQMESILNQEMPVKQQKRLGLFWWMGLSSFLLISFLAYIYIDFPSVQSVAKEGFESKIIAKESELKSKSSESNLKSVDGNVSSVNNDKNEIGKHVEIDEVSNIKNLDLQEQNLENNPIVHNGFLSKKSRDQFTGESILFASQKSIESQVPTLAKGSEVFNEFNTSDGKESIKNRLKGIYKDPYIRVGLENKEETVANVQAVDNNETPNGTIGFVKLDRLPIYFSTLYYNSDTVTVDENQFVNFEKDKGNWSFGGFTSYQYVDMYFRGYDLGSIVTYDQGGRWSLGARCGFERLTNTKTPVLKDAIVAVPWGSNVLSNDQELNDGSIFNSTQSAGFELRDVITSRNDLMMEVVFFYQVSTKISLSSGFGYKRLLSVHTRSISAFDDDSQSFINNNKNSLNSSEILNTSSVNRNRLHIPLEIKYEPIERIAFSLGSQVFLNNNFKEFNEKARSIYARVSFKF